MARHKKVLFRVLYPNRWLVWVGAVAVMCTIVLVGFITQYSIEQEYQFSPDDISYTLHVFRKSRAGTIRAGDVSGWKTYRDGAFSFEIKIPPRWSADDDTALVVGRNSAYIKHYSFATIERGYEEVLNLAISEKLAVPDVVRKLKATYREATVIDQGDQKDLLPAIGTRVLDRVDYAARPQERFVIIKAPGAHTVYLFSYLVGDEFDKASERIIKTFVLTEG